MSRPLPVCRATRRRHSVGTVSSLPIAILCSCAAWQACGEAERIAAIRALSRAWRCSTCLCIRHRRGESVLHGRQRRPSQGRRAAVASTVVAVGHVRAAAGAARGPQCPEIPHARQARRAGDRTNRPRKADHGIGVNRAFKSGSWEAAPHFRKNHQVHLHHIFQKLSIRNRMRLPISAVCFRSPRDRRTGNGLTARLCNIRCDRTKFVSSISRYFRRVRMS